MTNFDYLAENKLFVTFAEIAISAEKAYSIDPSTSVVNSRRALEAAVRWMYSVNKTLTEPWQDSLAALIHEISFKNLIGDDLFRRINYIRKLGNNAAHNSEKITPEKAELALKNLFVFLDYIDYCYSDNYIRRRFDSSLLQTSQNTDTATKTSTEISTETSTGISRKVPTEISTKTSTEISTKIPAEPQAQDETLQQLIKQNALLVEELTNRSQIRKSTYAPYPLKISEYKTRKLYIDTELDDAGWVLGKDRFDEYELSGMPNKSEVGFADYVLFGDDGLPLAVVEAKKTCVDVSVGRQQAKLYADLLEAKFKRRPIIFLTNGFETRIWDDKNYPERKISTIYTKRDLEKEFNKYTRKTSISNAEINESITDRPYQKEAIKTVCDAFESKHRKALLVMATGSGKTRVVMSIVDILLRHNWIKNILFLSDRVQLVRQANRAFVNKLPNLQSINLCDEMQKKRREKTLDKSINARAVFSTYQTMMGAIDEVKDEEGRKIFSCGHFDLIIIDEAHRSIYNKYKDIFTYFDALLIGLTATPKSDIDKNTYEIFGLEDGMPTYGYDLDQAVRDGYLVDYATLETKFKFLQEGINYDDLTDAEKEAYEKYFADETGEVPDSINASALNEWVFNEDTIKKVLQIVMDKALRIEHGSNIGKTIIFAKNHRHAEKIYEIFGKQYPNYSPNYCRVIDNYTKYADSLIDEFSDPKKMPMIAISVDMLDTGIDIPEILNLVFFKRVFSRAKFWQMIGRGTRLCPGLIDGHDKNRFIIFDFCSNFEFFRVNPKGVEDVNHKNIQARIFDLKNRLIHSLQKIEFADNEELMSIRNQFIDENVSKVCELNRENSLVRQHLKYVEIYSTAEGYTALSYENVCELEEHIAHLILPYDGDVEAVSFDSLLYTIELASLSSGKAPKARKILIQRVRSIANLSTIPEVVRKKSLIHDILFTDYLNKATIVEFEHIRKELRSLMKFIEYDKRGVYDTNFEDEMTESTWSAYDGGGNDFSSYREKAEVYLRKYEDIPVIQKLKTNVPLSVDDIKVLECILWNDIGDKATYDKEVNMPLGVFVRGIVGLDMNAAKAAFSKFLTDESLNGYQINFVNKIVEYIVKNGTMMDLSVLMKSPFTNYGSVSDLFDMQTIVGIKKVIDGINRNASVV